MANEPERLLGESPAFLRILEEVSLVAPLDKPVLIVGERGTGKELIAARLHFLSNRWEGEYVKMNCAAISDSLLETELFGHEAGAFTGASKPIRGALNALTAVPSFSMNSPLLLPWCRKNCCASLSMVNTSGWAEIER